MRHTETDLDDYIHKTQHNIYIYIYIYKERDRQTERRRHGERETEVHTYIPGWRRLVLCDGRVSAETATLGSAMSPHHPTTILDQSGYSGYSGLSCSLLERLSCGVTIVIIKRLLGLLGLLGLVVLGGGGT